MVSLEEMPDKISSIIDDYEKGKMEEIEAVMEKTALKMIEDIKANAPRGKSKEPMRDSFTYQKQGEGGNLIVTIYSKSKGRLLHLIEFGFIHRSGVFVSARPFLRPAYEKYIEEMVNKIKTILGG